MSQQEQPQGLNPDYAPQAIGFDPGPNLLNEEAGSWPIAIRYINILTERIYHLEHHIQALAMRYDPPESQQLADVRQKNTELETTIRAVREANAHLMANVEIANAEIAKLQDICRKQEEDHKAYDLAIDQLLHKKEGGKINSAGLEAINAWIHRTMPIDPQNPPAWLGGAPVQPPGKIESRQMAIDGDELIRQGRVNHDAFLAEMQAAERRPV